MFAYVDEAGNTGQNLFDEAQPFFLTAALVTRTHFDVLCQRKIASFATRLGVPALHANQLGLARLEAIAEDMLTILKKADARFVLCKLEKKYLAITKIVDHVFDSGENLAVPWQAYNLRPLRLLLVFKVAHLVDASLAKEFWTALMEPNKSQASRRFVEACRALLSRVDQLPDRRSREVVSDALIWATENPDEFHIHSRDKEARYGHLPNMVAFKNLIDGLDAQSQRWNRPVRLIVHDEQTQFERNLKNWHELYSNASSEPFYWPGEEPRVLRVVSGSKLIMSRGHESAGIQVVDTVLWLFKRMLDDKPSGPGTKALLDYALRHAWYNDFSFKSVGTQLEERMEAIMSAELSDEQMQKAAGMLAQERERRVHDLAEHAKKKRVQVKDWATDQF